MITHSKNYDPLYIGWHLKIISWGVIFFLILPVLLLVFMSFGSAEIIEFPPSKISLDQYRKFFSHKAWQNAVINSLSIASLTAIVSTTIGLLASIGLVRGRFSGKDFINAFILSPMIVPLIVLGLAYYISLAKTGLIGTKLGLIIAYIPLTLPFSVLPISASLKGFDISLEKAAMGLGASRIRAFMKITLPLISPGVITGALFSFIVAFDEVVIAMFICGPTSVTLPKKMWDVIRYEIEPMLPAVSTLIFLLSLIILTLIMIIQKRLSK